MGNFCAMTTAIGLIICYFVGTTKNQENVSHVPREELDASHLKCRWTAHSQDLGPVHIVVVQVDQIGE